MSLAERPTPRPQPSSDDTGVRLHHFTVDEYHRMRESGVFQGDNPVELLNGRLYIKGDYGPPYDVPLGIPPAEIAGPDVEPFPQRKFTVREYHRLMESGALPPELRTELVEGWVVDKMVRNAPHDSALQRVDYALRCRLDDAWVVRQQSGLTMDNAELEPDFAIVPGPVRRYDQSHPVPDDVALLIEVSSSTLGYDARVKKRDYARNGIARYWIVNLKDRRGEVYEDPTGPTAVPEYGTSRSYQLGESVPLILRDQTLQPIAVDEVLPAL